MPELDEKFLGFFSYVHANDKHARWKLTNLRKALQDEVWDQTGKSFRIFQDTEGIEWGQDWKERIKDALDSSTFLFAIVTPSYLVSKPCRFEFEYFLKRESQLNRKLIFPILYIDTPKLNDRNDLIATEISKRQWLDWRDLRFSSLTSTKVHKKLELLAKQIRELIDETIFVDINTNSENEYQLPDSVISKTVVHTVEEFALPTYKYPALYAPIAKSGEETNPPQQITILVHLTEERERNKRRIKVLHSTLISFKGRDRFSFHIFEGGKGTLIDFPNDTTRVCPEMLTRLRNLMGEESWRVEEITFE